MPLLQSQSAFPHDPQLLPTNTATIATTHQTPLQHYISALEAPLSNTNQSSSAATTWELEDSSLLPTFDDWLLIFQDYVGPNGIRATPFTYFDSDDFLTHFFQKPSILRLIQCALSASYTGAPEDVKVSYYKRARKALVRASDVMETPTVDTVLTLYLLYDFSMIEGQPVIGRQFLFMAGRLVLELGLHVDPDFESVSSSNDIFSEAALIQVDQMDEREKERRRRVFWGVVRALVSVQMLATDPFEFDQEMQGFWGTVDLTKVKGPQQVYAPHPVFAMEAVHIDCALFSLIYEIKRAYATPPVGTVQELIQSMETFGLSTRLATVHHSIPVDYFLLSTSPSRLTRPDMDRFIDQIKNARPVASILSLNLALLTSISVLHRPVLFLTSLPCCHPLILDDATRAVLTQCIQACVTSAYRIINLFLFSHDILKGVINPTTPLSTDVMASFHVSGGEFAVMEAMIVLWFVTCRMEGSWWPFVDVELRTGYQVLRGAFLKLGDMQRERGVEASGIIAPLVRCVEAMVREMDAVNGWVGGGSGSGGIGDEVDSVELGMKVMSIGGDEHNVKESFVADPWGYLGLLGMEVDGRVRWRGRTEDSWRLFWKLNS
ncbi:hypothetical protein BCR33DRAFT_720338 [Rhizoclosmatium globosum]|uniref:Xylanolytic transcriptional activator regulatory domain-containing protein n=1 Tax=Rhizoclosmatium globosum TaxID=329046 RepID=A0A1Y2BWF2_9FUNG|nr:hypothetical protein BCR33DRAFT_720338 [Rhizoclosmatium globosum]|eukprot:ORY39089.1 hypothetical protein BCR33DRAFT_720338 [Rhizoclosmatium globosum]